MDKLKRNIYTGETEGIILAAGLSTRMGINKLLLEIDGSTIIERCIHSMYHVCSRIILVGGHRIDDIRYLPKKYPKIELVHNKDYLNGMFSSVKVGLSQVNKERLFLIPGDYPMINKATYVDMLKAKGDIVVPLYDGKKGHPLLIKNCLIDEILNDSTLNSLRDYIGRKRFVGVDVEDRGILLDVDHIDDYHYLIS